MGRYQLETPRPNSQVHDENTFGILPLTLPSTSNDWAFIPITGGCFTDTSTTACH
jgi:acid phosphatase type 7